MRDAVAEDAYRELPAGISEINGVVPRVGVWLSGLIDKGVDGEELACGGVVVAAEYVLRVTLRR